jgi:hypothetical protein
VFRSVGESPLAVSQDRVLSYIQQKGLASREDILSRLYRHMTDDQLTTIIYILLHAGKIREETQSHKTFYVDNRVRP